MAASSGSYYGPIDSVGKRQGAEGDNLGTFLGISPLRSEQNAERPGVTGARRLHPSARACSRIERPSRYPLDIPSHSLDTERAYFLISC
jgi:hypothetical protein